MICAPFFFCWSQRFCKENGWTFIILNSKLWRYSQKHRNQWHISVPMLKATKEHQFLRFPTFMSFSTHMTPGQVLSDDCTIYDSRHVSTNNLTKGHRRAIKYSIARFIRTARPPPLANCKTAVPPKSPQPHVLFSLRVAVPSPSRWNRREGGSPRLCFTMGEGGSTATRRQSPVWRL